MKLFSKKERSSPVEDLISEQRQKEEARVWRRGWCIQQATYVCDECSAATVIHMAREIYEYVYGEVDAE